MLFILLSVSIVLITSHFLTKQYLLHKTFQNTNEEKLIDTISLHQCYYSTLYSDLAYENVDTFKEKVSNKNAIISFIDASLYSQEDTQLYLYTEINNNALYVIFRGTSDLKDVQSDINIRMIPFEEDNAHDNNTNKIKKIKIHRGFYNQYRSIRDKLYDEIQNILQNEVSSKIKAIIFTGHSLGGALATIAAYDCIENCNYKKIGPYDIKCFTIGAPRVGNSEFVQQFENCIQNQEIEYCRIYNIEDPVSNLPMYYKYKHIQKNALILSSNSSQYTFKEYAEDSAKIMRPYYCLLFTSLCSPIAGHHIELYKKNIENIILTLSHTKEKITK